MKVLYYFLLTIVSAFLLSICSTSQVAHAAFHDYYTSLRVTSHKYNRYQEHGYYRGDQDNPIIGTNQDLAQQSVHVVSQQTTPSGSYVKLFVNHKNQGWINSHALNTNTYRLNVPLIAQRPQLPTGCEITATTMMLNFAGDNSTKLQLTKEMPRSSDPNQGFVGNPYKKSGWYIYPKGLLGLVRHHLGSAINLTGASITTLKHQVRKNKPVVVWLSKFDGFSNHAVTMTGYTNKRVCINDPWTNQKRSLSNSFFNVHHKLDASRALSY